MDVLFIVFVVIFTVFFIIFIPFAAARKREHLSGEYGERKISELLLELKTQGDEIINNFIASRNKSKTSSVQIDHIFITHKGVFVIETKDYKGRIYGSINQEQWTQVLAYGNTKNQLYNPIKQNQTHCHYIDSLVDGDFKIFNVVIFLRADFSRVSNSNGFLFEPYTFSRWYKSLPKNDSMDDFEILRIKQLLLDEMLSNPITKEEHIQNIKRRHN